MFFTLLKYYCICLYINLYNVMFLVQISNILGEIRLHCESAEVCESVQLLQYHLSSSVGGYLQHLYVSLLCWKSHMHRCKRFTGISANVINVAAAADDCTADGSEKRWILMWSVKAQTLLQSTNIRSALIIVSSSLTAVLTSTFQLCASVWYFVFTAFTFLHLINQDF